jgi:hypothetical protein
LIYQIRKYGVLPETQIHLLDAIAYGKDVWMPGYDMKLIEEMLKRKRRKELKILRMERLITQQGGK